MNEFQRLLHEAFAGLEPYDPAPGRAAIEEAIRGFERRDRLLRRLVWYSVLFMTAVCVASAWRFFTADPADVRALVLYAVLFLFGLLAIGWQKMTLFTSQQSLRIEIELKRLQLMLRDRA